MLDYKRVLRISIFIILGLLISGCAKLVHYDSDRIKIKSEQSAVNIIERAYYQEPEKYRPENIVITTQYILLSYGKVTKVDRRGFGSTTAIANANTNYQYNQSQTNVLVSGFSGGKSSETLRMYEKNERIYFSSIDDIKLYTKKNRYIVSLDTNSGNVLDRVVIYSKEDATEFIAAINYLIKNSTRAK